MGPYKLKPTRGTLATATPARFYHAPEIWKLHCEHPCGPNCFHWMVWMATNNLWKVRRWCWLLLDGWNGKCTSAAILTFCCLLHSCSNVLLASSMSHDVCTNETELRSIVQQHVVELFCYPLSMYTSTLYHVNHLHTLMGEQAKEEKEGKEQESMMLHKHKLAVLASTAHTVSFFAKDFLYHCRWGGTLLPPLRPPQWRRRRVLQSIMTTTMIWTWFFIPKFSKHGCGTNGWVKLALNCKPEKVREVPVTFNQNSIKKKIKYWLRVYSSLYT